MLLECDAMSRSSSTKRPIVEPQPRARIGQAEHTRAEILDAALQFLWSRPFREMTVNSLMATIPISRPAFYKYFDDIYGLMHALMEGLWTEILAGASPWLSDDGDPVALLYESLAAEARICYRYGPFLKAIGDAKGGSERLEDEWNSMFDIFDDAVGDRIVADQELGLIETFEPRPVANALNRTSDAIYVQLFGQRPRRQWQGALDTVSRIWISTLYGQRWVKDHKSTLYRRQPLVKHELQGRM